MVTCLPSHMPQHLEYPALFDSLWKELRNLEKYIKKKKKSPKASKRIWGKLEMWKRLKRNMITDCKYL